MDGDATGTVRLRLEVSYDGTGFAGWALQPGQRTVAGALMIGLDRIFGPGRAVGLTVAGRTDAGVHATGQVCHLDLPAHAWSPVAGTAVRRLAGVLPPDVRVRAVGVVPDTFDARFSALSRRYAYRVDDRPSGPCPLRRWDTLGWPRPVDLERLNAAAQPLRGEHDFAAYCRRKEHATTVRRLTRFDWQRAPDGVVVATVEADAFCQSMVRSLVGAVLAAGDGRRSTGWPQALLSRRERANEVSVAPAFGLTLVAVSYPADPGEFAARAEVTRRRREPTTGPAGAGHAATGPAGAGHATTGQPVSCQRTA